MLNNYINDNLILNYDLYNCNMIHSVGLLHDKHNTSYVIHKIFYSTLMNIIA